MLFTSDAAQEEGNFLERLPPNGRQDGVDEVQERRCVREHLRG